MSGKKTSFLRYKSEKYKPIVLFFSGFSIPVFFFQFPLHSTSKYCSTIIYFITSPLTLQATEFTPTKEHFTVLYQFEWLLRNILWHMMHCITFLKYNASVDFFFKCYLLVFSLFLITAACSLFFELLPVSWRRTSNLCSYNSSIPKLSEINAKTLF